MGLFWRGVSWVGRSSVRSCVRGGRGGDRLACLCVCTFLNSRFSFVLFDFFCFSRVLFLFFFLTLAN